MSTPDLAAVAARLADELHGVSDRLDQVKEDGEQRDDALKKYGRRNRLLIRVAVVGLLLDFAATGISVYALAQGSSNAATVSQLHQNNVSACELGNQRLAQQERALDSILGIGGKPETARQAAILARARGYVAGGWGPRNCEAIYAPSRP